MIISCARHSTQGNGNTVAITVLLQLHHTRKVVKVDALLKPGSDKYTLQYPVPVRGDVLFNKHTCVNHLSVVPKAHLSVFPKAHLSVCPQWTSSSNWTERLATMEIAHASEFDRV